MDCKFSLEVVASKYTPELMDRAGRKLVIADHVADEIARVLSMTGKDVRIFSVDVDIDFEGRGRALFITFCCFYKEHQFEIFCDGAFSTAVIVEYDKDFHVDILGVNTAGDMQEIPLSSIRQYIDTVDFVLSDGERAKRRLRGDRARVDSIDGNVWVREGGVQGIDCGVSSRTHNRGTYWVNIYPDSPDGCRRYMYDSKESADSNATSDRIACKSVFLSWENGEGL